MLTSGQTHAVGRSGATFAVSDPRTTPQESCQCMLTAKSPHRVRELDPPCAYKHLA